MPGSLEKLLPPPILLGLIYSVAFINGIHYEMWDDGFFYKRFALNFLDGNRFSWNAGDGPVYGITSQLFLWLVTTITAVAGDYYQAALRLTTYAMLYAAFWFSRAWAIGSSVKKKMHFVFFTAPVLYPLADSGMETVMFLLFGVLLLRDSYGWAKMQGVALVSRTTLWCVAVYLLRPDMLLLALAFTFFNLWQIRPRLALFFGATSALALTCVLLGLFGYYDTALPLSFYVKSKAATIYGKHFIRVSEPDRIQHLLQFLFLVLPALYCLGIRIQQAVFHRNWQLLFFPLSIVLFIAYHFLSTIDVMGMAARFYMPAWPFLLYVLLTTDIPKYHRKALLTAGLVFTALVFWFAYHKGLVPNLREGLLDRIHWLQYVAYLIPLAICFWFLLKRKVLPTSLTVAVLLMPLFTLLGQPHFFKTEWTLVVDDTSLLKKYNQRYTTTRGLYALKKCAEPKFICHSEIGAPGLVLANTHITDWVGLMNKPIALGRSTPSKECFKNNPEAFFLPHRNYKKLNRQIQRSPVFKNYKQAVSRSSSPLFVRKDLWSLCESPTKKWRSSN